MDDKIKEAKAMSKQLLTSPKIHFCPTGDKTQYSLSGSH